MENKFRKTIARIFLTLALMSCATSVYALEAQAIEVVSTSPYIAIFRRFLSDEECDALIEKAKPYLARSRVIDEQSTEGKVDEQRTSDGMFFTQKLMNPLVSAIEDRIASVTSIPKENGEFLQVLHYFVGQEFKPHHDYFYEDKDTGRDCQRGGQRAATLVMYLNTPEAGGQTMFPLLKIKIKPVKGDALFFYNCDQSGNGNPLSLHQGAPVIHGEKWTATKWMRFGRHH